ncbi:hypothetical protein NC653_022223 [Populus alba x Populus x berolinensis]|uniref:Uncharacterized protein n=1 Tax=Populus alba x Populus x berolinensis TaxID=444605 RepID=A0AAD6ME90_9ROSI|nr:hypothetical protein NC653_022223 [Populus alba x Populus x berolinensis]
MSMLIVQGVHAGTPLHHAEKRGLEQTVKLLLTSGGFSEKWMIVKLAHDVARIKGNINIVRTIESHICYFSAWLREFYGPGFLRAFAPQDLSRKMPGTVLFLVFYLPTYQINLLNPRLITCSLAAVIPQGSSHPMTAEEAGAFDISFFPSSLIF